MPIYEYECRQCGAVEERIETTPKRPPVCCHKPMVKIISYKGMPVFHGPGFYATEHGTQKFNKIPEID